MTDKFAQLRLAAHAATLRGCTMFADLPQGEIERLAAIVQVRRISKGEYLFREGDPVAGFYIVRKGAVSLQRLGSGGAEKVIHVFRKGMSFAEGALANRNGYPVDAVIVEEADLLFVPRSEFLDILRSNPDLALAMLASMNQHLVLLVNALEDLQGKDVESRLAQWLLRRCPRPFGEVAVEVPLDVTKTVLAAELKTRNETLSRALAKLREAGLLEVQGRLIRVLHPRRLRERLPLD
ncbi:MAG: Crp/Fnr family transcriptional regulator [Verrucomicrobiales bacterium]|nr:Crp/Fnr family transcriptional regulator [Verrucomicrobiales bacterium]